MKQLGMVTIGQAPRTDVAPIVERYIDKDTELVQAGALDGLSQEEILAELAPAADDYILTSRLTDGTSVTMGRKKVKPLIQKRLTELEEAGIQTILLLCTGVFHDLACSKAVLVEPDRIIPPAVKALIGDKVLGVVSPLKEQMDNLTAKFQPHGIQTVAEAADPYHPVEQQFHQAAESLKQQGAEVIILDCMGFNEEMRKFVQETAGMPVILSNALMAKLVSEII